MTDPFISRDDLSAFLGTELDPGDLMVVIALDSACEIVRGYLDQDIDEADHEILMHGNGRDVLLLPDFLGISEVTSVTEEDTVLEDTDYILDVKNGMLYRVDDVWCIGRNNIAIEYETGWNLTDRPYPSDVRLVALLLARRTYSAGGTDETGTVVSETMGNYSYTLSSDEESAGSTSLTNAEMAILDRYVARGVA